MKFLKPLLMQLTKEFPEIDQKVLIGVTCLVGGKADEQPVEKTFNYFSEEENAHESYTKDELESMVHEILLKTARLTCQNPERLKVIEERVSIILEKSPEIFSKKRPFKAEEPPVQNSTIGKNTATLFQGNNEKCDPIITQANLNEAKKKCRRL